MKRNTKKYTLNAGIIFLSILAFAYLTTYIHEIGHALMVWFYGGQVLQFSVNGPLSFDSVSGYVVSSLPYNIPIVIGGTLATTLMAGMIYLFARRTLLSYMMLCAAVCTLYNAVYSLSAFNDFTWLATQSVWGAMLCVGFVVMNLYLAQQGLNDLFEDMWEYRTLGRFGGIAAMGFPRAQKAAAALSHLTIIKE